MQDIVIFGAGGFGREVKMLLEDINSVKREWNFLGFFDDARDKTELINDSPVLGGITELNNWNSSVGIVFAIGNPIVKKKIVKQVNNSNIFYPILIHPNVLLGSMKYNSIGEGCILTAGNILTVNINLGCHVILNLSCTVGHDTNIGNYSSFMPSVNISGEVNIGESVYAGTGVKIINQIVIGENTIIGAGAVVAKDLPANCTAVGIPAKPVKFNQQ